MYVMSTSVALLTIVEILTCKKSSLRDQTSQIQIHTVEKHINMVNVLNRTKVAANDEINSVVDYMKMHFMKTDNG